MGSCESLVTIYVHADDGPGCGSGQITLSCAPPCLRHLGEEMHEFGYCWKRSPLIPMAKRNPEARSPGCRSSSMLHTAGDHLAHTHCSLQHKGQQVKQRVSGKRKESGEKSKTEVKG